MKTTDQFKEVIHNYLKQRAETDKLFAVSFAKPGKTIELCITHILTTVQKSGVNGFSDDEIYSMAVHYYDEDNLKVGKPVNCKVVINHQIELSEDEKKLAKEAAMKQAQEMALKAMTTKVRSSHKQEITQPSLF